MRSELHHQRHSIAEPDALKAGGVTENDTATRLAGIWEDVLGLESIGIDQNYFDLGGDSSLTVQVFSRIEKAFKVKLPLAILFEAPTIAELARILHREISESGCSSLVAIQPCGSRPPFFCIHGAGGNVLMYHDLSHHLGPDQPFYGLQSQGLDGASSPLTRIEDMAALYVKEIRKVRPHGPYFLGGYCMGGTIAFEMARQLDAEGETIALLALFDTMNWPRVAAPSKWGRGYYLGQRFAFHVAGFLRLDSKSKLNVLAHKFNFNALRHIVSMARNEVPECADAASSESLVEQIWEANNLACSNYAPKSYPGTVVDFQPMKQYRMYNQAHLKWNSLAQGGQDVVVLPVYPDEMLAEPFVTHLAVALGQSVDRAIRNAEISEARPLAVQLA